MTGSVKEDKKCAGHLVSLFLLAGYRSCRHSFKVRCSFLTRKQDWAVGSDSIKQSWSKCKLKASPRVTQTCVVIQIFKTRKVYT